MRKIYTLLLLVFTGFAILPSRAADRFTGALLWEVSGNGLESSSYILGTYHLFSKGFADSIPGLKDAMAAADRIVGELDLLTNRIGMQMDISTASMMPKEISYKALLSDKEYSRLEMLLKDILGMEAEEWGIYKPAMVSLLVASAVYVENSPGVDMSTLEVIDISLQQEMASAGKEVMGLESTEEQIYVLFDSEPLRVQAKDLLCAVLNLDYQNRQQADILKYYRSGELDKLYDVSFNDPENPCPPSEAYKNIILKDRNFRWLEKLPAIMVSAPSLVVVGALHLGGEEGLLFQLDGMGYEVSPMK